MKIAIFSDMFFPQVNGVATATINLSKGLADKGHEIIIIAPKFPRKIQKDEFKYSNIKIIRVFSFPTFFYKDFRSTIPINFKILHLFYKEKVDIIHFQTHFTLGFQAIFCSKFLKIPLVGTFHGFISDPQYLEHMKLNYKSVEQLVWKYSKWYYNKCNLITCPSEYAKKELLIHNFKSEIKVISNGIDASIFDNSKAKAVRKKYTKKGNLLLFVGRVAYEKNLIYLLECFRLVADELPNTKLLIVGDGPQMGDVKKKISELGLLDNIFLLGMIPHNQFIKSSIIGACDLFVTASITENQPMTILESQANGLVCVGADAKGVPNLIKNAVNGYVVNPDDKKAFADAVIKILSNKKLHQKMKNNTFKEIENHKFSKVIDQWENIYSKLIKNYNSRL
ncbi:glycosyltransferase [Candidatus Pacearchaeota archaeon]|nr:glycosyltransferase [Candidatus Pacearchaeota archaeon]